MAVQLSISFGNKDSYWVDYLVSQRGMSKYSVYKCCASVNIKLLSIKI